MDKLKRALSGDDDDEEQGIVTQIYEGSSLSWSTRIKGFCICFILGVTFSLIGSLCMFLGSLNRGMVLFAVFYSLGNIVSLGSTCFLMGPVSQCKKMFAETRIFATIIMFVCIVLTLCSALWWKNAGLVLLFCIMQFCALAWYSISYIPFARDAIKKCVGGCLS